MPTTPPCSRRWINPTMDESEEFVTDRRYTDGNDTYNFVGGATSYRGSSPVLERCSGCGSSDFIRGRCQWCRRLA